MKTILMTTPTNFGIQYEINPWMHGNIGLSNKNEVVKQWSNLRNALIGAGADVVVLPASPEYCPDAVFTANAGLIYKNLFISSRFRNEERAAEEPFFIKWFLQHGYTIPDYEIRATREQLSFEGAGDALFNKDRKILWMGVGFRSSLGFKALLDDELHNTDIIVRPLELVNSKFYHLDTCFCPLDTGELIWYPPAFSDYSRMVIESWYEGRDIKVTDEDAALFACNSVSVGSTIISPIITPFLNQTLISRGYTVVQCDMSQFLKSGGACKCLTIEVVE